MVQLCEAIHLPLRDLQCKLVDTAQVPHQSLLQAQNALISDSGLGSTLAYYFLHFTSSRQLRKLRASLGKAW